MIVLDMLWFSYVTTTGGETCTYVMDDTVSIAYVCTQAVCQTDTGFILLYTADAIKTNPI